MVMSPTKFLKETGVRKKNMYFYALDMFTKTVRPLEKSYLLAGASTSLNGITSSGPVSNSERYIVAGNSG